MNGGDASNGGATQSRGNGAAGAEPEPRVPTKNGVPIGDCKEPTPEELMAAGCPPVEPVAGDACDLPEGTSCEYGIVTDYGLSEQRLAICEGRAWSQIFQSLCGATCQPLGPSRTLDTADCFARTAEPCKTTSLPDKLPMSAYGATLGQLDIIIVGGCDGPIAPVNEIELEFAGGCPSSVSAPSRTQAPALDCVVNALANVRWECAAPIPCVNWVVNIRD
jgi:hypothetical protein